MTATTTARLAQSAGEYPHMGTLPIAANTLILMNTMVAKNAAGYAVPATAGSGLPVYGISVATYDNRTGSEMGGLNGSGDAEIKFGVWGMLIDGDSPQIMDRVYALDNQTVTTESDAGHGVAGIVSEVRDGLCYVWMGPHVNGQMGLARVALVELTDDLLTDADGSQSFNLGSALPAGAVLLGYNVNVTEGFTDGATGVFTLDIGFSGDLDNVLDGGALGSIAQLHGSAGGRRGGTQLLATVLADVNVVTATAGAATVEVFYTLA